jgi:hypothetical protein
LSSFLPVSSPSSSAPAVLFYLPFSFSSCSFTFTLLLLQLYYAASRKVACSSPDEVDFFNWPNPSSRTMALESTQPLTEMTTRNLPGG